MIESEFPRVPYSEWRRQVESQLGEMEFGDALTFSTHGIHLPSLCTSKVPDRSERPEFEVPDAGRQWIPCQRLDEIDGETFHRSLRSALKGGVGGLRFVLGRSSLGHGDGKPSRDFRLQAIPSALRGSDCRWKLLVLDAGGLFLPAAAGLLASYGEVNEVPENGTVILGVDPLGSLAAEGCLSGSLEQLSEDLAELVRYSQEKGEWIRSVGVSTEPYREAGAEIDQELAICLATGTEYLRWLEAAGHSPEVVAREISFFTSTGHEIFLEIAKLRALRVLWREVLRSCGLAAGERSHPWIHASVMRRGLPSCEPTNNLMRITSASWATVAGGVDSLDTPAFDWSESGGSSERGQRLARNTQLILQHEAQMGRVFDPGRGAYFVETATGELVRRSWELFQEIERRGGLLNSLVSGWLQESIQIRWNRRHEGLQTGQIPFLGVNTLTEPGIDAEADDSGLAQHPVATAGPSPDRQESPRSEGEGGIVEISGPTDRESRWQWCLGAASRGASVRQMTTLLYGEESELEVSRLPVHSDGEAAGRGRETP